MDTCKHDSYRRPPKGGYKTRGKGGRANFQKDQNTKKKKTRYQKPKKTQPSPTRREGQSLFVANREEKGKANQRRILCHVLPPHLPPPPYQDKKKGQEPPTPHSSAKTVRPSPPHTPQNAIRYMCIYEVVVVLVMHVCMHCIGQEHGQRFNSFARRRPLDLLLGTGLH